MLQLSPDEAAKYQPDSGDWQTQVFRDKADNPPTTYAAPFVRRAIKDGGIVRVEYYGQPVLFVDADHPQDAQWVYLPVEDGNAELGVPPLRGR